MDDPIKSLNLIDKFIVERGSSKAMIPHIAFLRDIITHLKEENERLEEEKEDLQSKYIAACKEIEQYRTAIPNTKFVEYRGAKFKRKSTGGFEASVYCPSCEVGMATIGGGGMPYVCGKCHALSGFESQELRSIFKELDVEFP